MISDSHQMFQLGPWMINLASPYLTSLSQSLSGNLTLGQICQLKRAARRLIDKKLGRIKKPTKVDLCLQPNQYFLRKITTFLPNSTPTSTVKFWAMSSIAFWQQIWLYFFQTKQDCWTSSRWQFHQHFTSSFFVRKFFEQLFCT